MPPPNKDYLMHSKLLCTSLFVVSRACLDAAPFL
jgi:hypothetical protein